MIGPEASFEPVANLSTDQLDTPALLIEQSKLDRNLSDMQALADRHGLALRPHIKTHKSIRGYSPGMIKQAVEQKANL